MLIAPFTSTDTPTRRDFSRRPDSRLVPSWLLAWAAIGVLGICLIPALRGDAIGGSSIPFWLVAAPLINIAWLTRARWTALLRTLRPGSPAAHKPTRARFR